MHEAVDIFYQDVVTGDEHALLVLQADALHHVLLRISVLNRHRIRLINFQRRLIFLSGQTGLSGAFRPRRAFLLLGLLLLLQILCLLLLLTLGFLLLLLFIVVVSTLRLFFVSHFAFDKQWLLRVDHSLRQGTCLDYLVGEQSSVHRFIVRPGPLEKVVIHITALSRVDPDVVAASLVLSECLTDVLTVATVSSAFHRFDQRC